MINSFIRTLFFCTLCAASAALAQQPFNPDRDQPLEITADQTLEWHRKSHQYIATGNAVAKQGKTTISADTLTADYRETGQAGFEIYRLTAAGNVTILSEGNKATGDRAVYDVDRGTAIMTGQNLQLISPDQIVTARDSFEYFVTEGRLSAIGGAKVVRGQDTISADRISALFSNDPVTGKRTLNKLTATGNVTITTPTETLTGQNAAYIAATEIATVSGQVRIMRGPNRLEGDQAEINLATSVSRMIGSPAQGGRVRGVFYPGSEKTQENQAPAPILPRPAQNQIQDRAQGLMTTP